MLILCVCTNPKISTALHKPRNVHSCAQPKLYGKHCAGCSSCAKFWAKRISTAVIYCTGNILRWMLKLSKFGAYTAQKLAQLGEKNSTSTLAVLVAFCISANTPCQSKTVNCTLYTLFSAVWTVCTVHRCVDNQSHCSNAVHHYLAVHHCDNCGHCLVLHRCDRGKWT